RRPERRDACAKEFPGENEASDPIPCKLRWVLKISTDLSVHTCCRKQIAAAAAAVQSQPFGRYAGAAAHHVPAGRRVARDKRSARSVALKVAGGRGQLIVHVNGVPMAPSGGRGTLFFHPDGPGFVRLTVMDARGAADSVTVRLQ